MFSYLMICARNNPLPFDKFENAKLTSFCNEILKGDEASQEFYKLRFCTKLEQF